MCWGDGERGRMSGPQYGTDKPWGPNGYFLGVGRWAGEQVNLLAVETLLSVPLFLAFASWSHTHTYTHTHTHFTPTHLVTSTRQSLLHQLLPNLLLQEALLDQDSLCTILPMVTGH